MWGGYAYGRGLDGREARADMEQSFRRIAVAAKNQDTREHDIVDSDDYFQYHGGMVAMVRALTGRSPGRVRRRLRGAATRCSTRTLAEETKRVFRARVVNPKWIAAMQRHGYKGAFELAATVDYLFGYDATAGVVDDWMYGQLAESYVFDETNRAFMEKSNPWALRGITERLLEAADRGMWAKPDDAVLDRLRQTYLDLEGDLEGAGSERTRWSESGSDRATRSSSPCRAANLLAKADVVFVPVADSGETGRAEQTVLLLRRGVAGRAGGVRAARPRAHRAAASRPGTPPPAQVAALVRRAPRRHRGVRHHRRPVRLLDLQLPGRVRPRRWSASWTCSSSRASRPCRTSPRAAGTPLVEGREALALFPMTAGADRFREALERGDAVVAYKFGRMLPETLAVLRETGRLDEAVYGAGSRPARRGHPARARELDPDEPGPYLSTLIVPPARAGPEPWPRAA